MSQGGGFPNGYISRTTEVIYPQERQNADFGPRDASASNGMMHETDRKGFPEIDLWHGFTMRSALMRPCTFVVCQTFEERLQRFSGRSVSSLSLLCVRLLQIACVK